MGEEFVLIQLRIQHAAVDLECDRRPLRNCFPQRDGAGRESPSAISSERPSPGEKVAVSVSAANADAPNPVELSASAPPANT